MDNMERLGQFLRDLEDGQIRFQTPQLAFSSLEDGQILEHDADGQVTSSWGKQYDGTHTIVTTAGPKPPTPVAAQVTAIPGAFEVRWNGKFVGDEVSPLDLKHISVHLSQTSGDSSILDQKATIRGELGDVATVLIPQEGIYYIRLVAWSLAGKASDFSEEVEVQAAKFVDSQTVDDLLDSVDGLITEAGELGAKLDEAKADLATNTEVINNLKDTVIPGVEANIQAARDQWTNEATALDGRLDTAETDLQSSKDRLTAAEGRVDNAFVEIGTAKELANTAQSTANTAKSDAASAAGIAGGKADVLIQSTTPATAMQKSTTLWIDTTGGTNKPKRWDGSNWVVVTDKAATDAATAAASADAKAVAAQTAASNAQTTADTAKSDAASAAGIAGGKADVLIQSTAPATAMRKDTTLWIDTTSSANTPKRWSGTAWVAVTDKAATDAAAAAVAADTKAQQALSAAGSAQNTADSALTMAGTKSTVLYSTSAPSGTGVKVNDIWRRIDTSKNVIGEWYWTGSSWQTSQITTTMISNLDVGKLTVGSGVIADLVAQAIAANTAAFQTVDVKNLFATTGTMTEAVITKLFTDVVLSRRLSAEQVAIGSFNNIIPDPEFVNDTGDWGATSAPYSFPKEGRAGRSSLKVAPATSQRGKYSKRIPVTGAETFRVSVWVKSDVDIPAGVLNIYRNHTTGTSNTVTGAATFLKQTNGSAGNDPIPANTWTQLVAIVPITSVMTTISLGFYVQGAFSTGIVWWSEASAISMANGSLTVDGSIDAIHINASEALSAKVGQFLTVRTDQLIASTGVLSQAVIDKLWTEVVNSRFITTEMLAVGSFDNLNGDPRYELNSFWTGLAAGPGSGFVDPITPNAPDNPTRLILMSTKTTVTSNMSLYGHGFTTKNRIPVTPGDAYVCWSYAYSDVADPTMTTISQQVYFYDAAGAMLSGSSGNMSSGSIKNSDWVAAAWNKVGGNPLIVPAGAAYMSPRLTVYKPASSSAATAVKYYVGPPHFTRAADGQIVVDGAIDGKTITGALLQTDNGTNKGIKFSTLFGISAFNDATGERTFYVEPVTGSVTMRGKFYSGSETGVATFIDDTANGNGYTGIVMQVTPTNRGYIKIRSSFVVGMLEPLGSLLMSSGGTDPSTFQLRPGTASNGGVRLDDNQGNTFDLSYYYGPTLQSTVAGKPIEIRNMNKSDGTFTSGITLLDSSAKLYGRASGTAFGPHLEDLSTGGRAGMKTNGSSYFQVENMWTSTSAANCYVATTGTLYRSTSKRANKLAIEDLSADRDDLILSLKARTWFDKRQSEEMARAVEDAENGVVCENENLTELRRIPGMVAEEVEEAGLTEFVQYGVDGQVEGLMYDRLGVALIPVVGRQRDRIDDLERRIQALES